jgi:putative endonuclease
MSSGSAEKRQQAALRGRAAEDRALAYLQQQGMQLVERNFSCRCGEIDLIMREQKTLVFVEVRQRSSAQFGGAAASVTATKQTRLWRTAEYYLQRYPKPPSCRFDLIAIESGELSWIRNIITH